MPLNRFDKFLPWTGAIAGVAWIVKDNLFHKDSSDNPGMTTTRMVHDHLALNYAGIGCLVIMGVALTFFATALRGRLRSGEAGEATYSGVAYAGILLIAAALSQMVVWNWGLVNGAAQVSDDAALHTLSFVAYFGFAGMGIGVAAAFLATGLGGLANAVLPRWFSIVTIVLGVLSALGAAGIPPGGLVTYLLLPIWLVTASVLIARRQRAASAPLSDVAAGQPHAA